MELQTILQTLREHVPFKKETLPGDIILVGMPSGLFYGVVQSIEPNIKKNWYNLNYKLLVVPPVDTTWILRVPQMTGEFFTINGENHFVIAVDISCAQKKAAEQQTETQRPEPRRLTLVKNEPDTSGADT
jgi:hypothetical protein